MENQDQPTIQSSASLEVREVSEQDREWVAKLYRHNKSQLGSFSSAWRNYSNRAKNPHVKWLCIEGLGFAKYSSHKKGVTILQKIAVSDQSKRKGLGRKLLSYIKDSVQLRVDVNNAEGNAFCSANGFVIAEQKKSLNGKRTFNVWMKSKQNASTDGSTL